MLNSCLPVGSEIRTKVKKLVSQIEEKKLYKGKGGEIIRNAICHLIHALCQSKLDLDEADLMVMFQTLKENFKHPNFDIQESAAKALHSMCLAFFNDQPGDFIVNEIKSLFKPSQVDEQINITRGYNMALGQLSTALIRKVSEELIHTLLANCVPKGKANDDAETRREAIKSLVNVVRTLGIAHIQPAQLLAIHEVFYIALDDYAVDRRGDVGSWVREETMVSLTGFVQDLVNNNEAHP